MDPSAGRPANGFGCALVGLGAALLAVGVAYGAAAAVQSVNTVGVTGRVVTYATRPGADEGYRSVAEYEVAGRRYGATAAVAFDPPTHAVGAPVRVLYRADDPAVGYIDAFTDRWLFPLVFTAGGAAFVAAGGRLAAAGLAPRRAMTADRH